MIYMRLTQGRWCAVDAADFEWLNQWKWHWLRSITLGNNGYAMRSTKRNGVRKNILMHREIIKCPAGLWVDHWDGNGLNNTRINLRRCTPHQNSANRAKHKTYKTGLIRKSCSSKYKGVMFRTRKNHETPPYEASIFFKGKSIYLGMHKNEVDAARAYDAKAFELFCEFAKLNFPEEYKDKIPSEAIPF